MVIMPKLTVLFMVISLAVLTDVGVCRVAGGESLEQLRDAPQRDFRGQPHINKASTDRNVSYEAPDKFITAGSATGITQYPWVVYLNVKTRDWTGIKIYTCGGSLVSSRHVITAAHCVDFQIRSYNDVDIYLAEYNTRTYPDDCVGSRCIKNVRMHPDNIIIHGRYERRSNANDIAMLRLKGSAPNKGYIRPIPLPTFNINDPRYEGTPLIITGWGDTENRRPSFIKRHAQVQLVARTTCWRYHPVTEGMLCAAGTNGQDSCYGDSGGPIMVESQGTLYLVGLVSFGSGNCGSSMPTVYTNVFSYLEWIQYAIRN